MPRTKEIYDNVDEMFDDNQFSIGALFNPKIKNFIVSNFIPIELHKDEKLEDICEDQSYLVTEGMVSPLFNLFKESPEMKENKKRKEPPETFSQQPLTKRK